ncbi:uri1 [Mactra antiquata]
MAGKESAEQWQRLHQEQIRALQTTDASIERWMQFISDFEALKGRLLSLPDKVTHDVMVPFGKMAFMPGQLVHTNEVLVLLGDNWFAERSAKQAAEIVDRRLQMATSNLEDLQKQKELLLPRQQFTNELEKMSKDKGEMFEIREEYDEEKERKWKEAHKKCVREQRKQTKQEEIKATKPMKQTPVSDDELWARLDQLELIETERHEVQKVGTSAEKKLEGFKYPAFSNSSANNIDNSNVNKSANNEPKEKQLEKILYTDSEDEVSSYSASDELDSDDDVEESTERNDEGGEAEEEDVVMSKGKIINFSHTSGHLQGNSDTNQAMSETGSTIDNPADIYKQYGTTTQPKSILKSSISNETKKKTQRKQKTRKPVVAFQTGSEEDTRNKVTMESRMPLDPAFTASVIERPMPQYNTTTDLSGLQHKQNPVSSSVVSSNVTMEKTTEDNPNNKPVSRFKAQRQKRLN